jgi:hypothetical protein
MSHKTDISKSIRQNFAAAKSCLDLSSDHSPILITLKADDLNQSEIIGVQIGATSDASPMRD